MSKKTKNENPILNKVCVVGDTPLFSPYGYVITDDGMIYSLIEQWCHGVILAILYPELTKREGYEPPNENYDVFEYQQFELDHYRETTVIRVSISPMSGMLNISKGKPPATDAQAQSLSAVIKEQGLSLSNTMQSDYSEITIAKFMKKLWKGEI